MQSFESNTRNNMKKQLFSFVILLLLIAILSLQDLYSQLSTVHTQNGTVTGTEIGNIHIFKGIPFASAPVGELRWKAPQPVKNWQGILKCESFSASPMQSNPVPFMMWSEEFITPPKSLSEDCLYLNIWTPAKSPADKLPVFVWIYGGGFTSGSAACAVYDGEELANKGIIFVSFNYRVGIFGFLAHPELSKESANKVSGNYGLLDQIAALQWIKENIAAFGGDPEKVTIAGQSAGSMSVGALIVSPLTRGLFRAAITQSGGIVGRLISKHLSDAEKSGLDMMQKMKAANLSELRKISANDLIAASGNNGMGSFGPICDGYVLPADIFDAFGKGQFNDIPLMTGWVTGDGALFGNTFPSPEKYKQQAAEKYGDKASEFLSLFPGNTPDEVKTSQPELNLLQFAGLPSHFIAGYMHNKTYLYEFSHVPADKPGFPNYGAFHTSDVPYALHTLKKWNRPWKTADYDVEKIMSDCWVNFIKTGDPNGTGIPEWKSYDKISGNIMEIGDHAVLHSAFFKKKFDFLETEYFKH
jgi:para-nitrobenzyl esterase